MGIGISLAGVGDILKGAGGLAKDIRSAVTGEISPEKKAELEARALELEAASMQAQADIIDDLLTAIKNGFITLMAGGAVGLVVWLIAKYMLN